MSPALSFHGQFSNYGQTEQDSGSYNQGSNLSKLSKITKRKHDRRTDLGNTFLKGLRHGSYKERSERKKREKRKTSEAARSNKQTMEKHALEVTSQVYVQNEFSSAFQDQNQYDTGDSYARAHEQNGPTRFRSGLNDDSFDDMELSRVEEEKERRTRALRRNENKLVKRDRNIGTFR